MSAVTPMVRFRFEAGEPFEVPAFYVIPHAGNFWTEPMIVIECFDPAYEEHGAAGFGSIFTRELTPWDERWAEHFAYTSSPGDVEAVNFDAEDEPRFRRTVYWKHLGIYRVWDVRGEDRQNGPIKFIPAEN